MKDIEDSIESQIIQANQAASKVADDVSKTKDEAVEETVKKVDQVKEQMQLLIKALRQPKQQ